MRKSPTRRNNFLIVCSFTPVHREDYRVGVPKKKNYKLIFTQDGFLEEPVIYKAKKEECDDRAFSIGYDLPPFGVAVFQY